MYVSCFFDKSNSENVSDNVLTLSYTEFTDEPCLFHSHPYAEVMIVLDGVGELFFKGRRIPLKKKALYIVNPNTEHTEHQIDSLKYFVMKIKNFTLYGKKQKSEIEMLRLSDKSYSELLFYFKEALSELRQNAPYKENMARELLSCAYLKVLRLLDDEEHFVSHESEKAISSRLQAIVDYISANHAKDLKLSEITKRFTISHNTLIRLFKKHLGISPKEFIIKKRLSIAKEALENTDYTINQISTVSGFSDFAYFSKIFKKEIGKTPTEYRRELKKT